jgi:hypothetical protein
VESNNVKAEVGGVVEGEEALPGLMRNTKVKDDVLGVYRRLSVDEDILKERRASRHKTAAVAGWQH